MLGRTGKNAQRVPAPNPDFDLYASAHNVSRGNCGRSLLVTCGYLFIDMPSPVSVSSTLMLYERIQVRVSNKTYKQLTSLAEADERDISTYVRMMIEKVLEAKEKHDARVAR